MGWSKDIFAADANKIFTIYYTTYIYNECKFFGVAWAVRITTCPGFFTIPFSAIVFIVLDKRWGQQHASSWVVIIKRKQRWFPN